MNRVTLTLLAVAFLPIVVSAQTAGQAPRQPTCTLTLDQSPTIRGLRLGMNTEQLFSLLPAGYHADKSAIDNAQGYPNYGVARLHLQEYLGFKDRFAGINRISLTFFDGQAAELEVNYQAHPSGANWPNVDAFIFKLTEAFALPDAGDWLYKSETSKTLKCNGFEIRASIFNGTGSISLSGKPYFDIVQQRAATDEERRRREFKP